MAICPGWNTCKKDKNTLLWRVCDDGHDDDDDADGDDDDWGT